MLTSDLQKLSVMGLVTLYELDATKLGGDIFRWHGHVSHEDLLLIFGYLDKTKYFDKNDSFNAIDTGIEYKRNIIWAGQTYSPVSIQSDGLEIRGDGRPSMPTLVIANQIDDTPGAITLLCAYHNDFVGATLKVTHVLAKYLDAANFTTGNPTANPNESSDPQCWYIEQKTEENERDVTFELTSPLSAQRKKIPTRNITPYCTWAVRGQYRGESCRYMGAAMFTEDGTPTDNPALDKCGGRIMDCKKRFGENEPLNFGGFAASQLRGR